MNRFYLCLWYWKVMKENLFVVDIFGVKSRVYGRYMLFHIRIVCSTAILLAECICVNDELFTTCLHIFYVCTFLNIISSHLFWRERMSFIASCCICLENRESGINWCVWTMKVSWSPHVHLSESHYVQISQIPSGLLNYRRMGVAIEWLGKQY